MRVNFFVVVVFFIVVFIYGCGNHKVNNNFGKETPHVLSDSIYRGAFDQLNRVTRKEFDISEVQKKRDTLSLIVMNREIYYPLGRLRNVDQLKHISPYLHLKNESYRDSVLDTVTLVRLSFKDSFIKFYQNSESGLFEIVSGKISNNEIDVYKTIRVGMSIDDFLRIYFNKNIDKFTKDINVIELVSGIDGIWQHYEFKDRRLVLINFISDYTFDKS